MLCKWEGKEEGLKGGEKNGKIEQGMCTNANSVMSASILYGKYILTKINNKK